MRKLSEVGFLVVDKVGTSSVVSVNRSCCTGLPHAADVVMGALASQPCCPTDLPTDVTIRAAEPHDMTAVLDIYAEGLATRNATFETVSPPPKRSGRWLPGHAWVAEVDGQVVGWTAITPVSTRACYAGVGESSVYVAEAMRGRGVGKALLYKQVNEADAGGSVDAADLDLPREPGQPRPAPLRRLPHPGRAHPHRAARRRVARHRPARAAQRGQLSRRECPT